MGLCRVASLLHQDLKPGEEKKKKKNSQEEFGNVRVHLIWKYSFNKRRIIVDRLKTVNFLFKKKSGSVRVRLIKKYSFNISRG